MTKRREIDAATISEQRLARDLASIDFASVAAAAAERRPLERALGGPCPVCHGAFGPVLDATELVRGQTLLTAHSFADGVLELRQISSTRHGDDLDAVPPMDAITLFENLSKAQSFLLLGGDARFPESGRAPDGGTTRRGWITITKKRRARGHGFQSIRLHPSEPESVARERAFVARHGAGRPSVLETRNPGELLIGEFRGGLAAAVPEGPTRAFETIVWFRPSATGLLCDLTGNQRWGLAQALREVTGALMLELSVRGLPERYAWRWIEGPGLEPFLRIVTPKTTIVRDEPKEWVEKLRAHIGVE
jgi:hypothetical protein